MIKQNVGSTGYIRYNLIYIYTHTSCNIYISYMMLYFLFLFCIPLKMFLKTIIINILPKFVFIKANSVISASINLDISIMKKLGHKIFLTEIQNRVVQKNLGVALEFFNHLCFLLSGLQFLLGNICLGIYYYFWRERFYLSCLSLSSKHKNTTV